MVKITNLVNNAIHLLSEGKVLRSGRKYVRYLSQSRQSSRLFLQSSECVPTPEPKGDWDTLACGCMGYPGLDEGTDPVVRYSRDKCTLCYSPWQTLQQGALETNTAVLLMHGFAKRQTVAGTLGQH
jgi:hypothetical protein